MHPCLFFLVSCNQTIRIRTRITKTKKQQEKQKKQQDPTRSYNFCSGTNSTRTRYQEGTGQDRAGPGKTGQDRTGPDGTGPDTTKQDRDGTKKSRANEDDFIAIAQKPVPNQSHLIQSTNEQTKERRTDQTNESKPKVTPERVN